MMQTEFWRSLLQADRGSRRVQRIRHVNNCDVGAKEGKIKCYEKVDEGGVTFTCRSWRVREGFMDWRLEGKEALLQRVMGKAWGMA